MAEIKRSAENPPINLQKAILHLSESQVWNEAKKEWEMANYYYVSGYISCRCGPRAVHNVTVIVNKYNFNELLICNSCAERLGLDGGGFIENSVRRLKKDITLNMNEISLDYLLKNKVIDTVGHYNYEKIREFREYNKNSLILEIRKQTNMKLLHFTDYNNKTIFDKIDQILIWSLTHYSVKIAPIAYQRNDLLRTGQCQKSLINDVIESHEMEITLANKEDARKLLDEFIQTSHMFAGKEVWPFAIYRWTSAEEYMKNKHIYMHMEYSELFNKLETMNNERLKAEWVREKQGANDFDSEMSSDLGNAPIDDDWDTNFDVQEAKKETLPRFSDEVLDRLEDASSIQAQYEECIKAYINYYEQETGSVITREILEDCIAEYFADCRQKARRTITPEMLEGLEDADPDYYEGEDNGSGLKESTLRELPSFYLSWATKEELSSTLEFLRESKKVSAYHKLNTEDIYNLFKPCTLEEVKDTLTPIIENLNGI